MTKREEILRRALLYDQAAELLRTDAGRHESEAKRLREEAARISGIAEGTLANLSCRREGPPFYRRGRKVLYGLENFIAWLTEYPVKTNWKG